MAKKLPIFYSAMLLTGVNLLLRFVGTSFQVYLSGRIGAEGIGLLQLVMSVGTMAMVAGMAGIRTATMYLTAESLGRKQSGQVVWVLSACIAYSFLASTAVGVAVYYFAPLIATHWIGQPLVTESIRLYASFLPINCLCGVMVGYFTGANRIGTLAAVEVVEQLFTMAATIAVLSLWAGTDAVKACQAVILGSGLGAVLTLSGLVILRLRERASAAPRTPILRRLGQIAFPLALADNLRTGISTVENLMVPKRLALYSGVLSPLAAFGTVCGMVFPILTFPMAILFGLNELLIPELARCNAAGSTARIQYLAKQSLRIALLFGCVCSCILFLAAEALCRQLYGSEEAGTYLRWFAPLAVMLYCDSVIDAMIKGLGAQKASVRYNICTNIMDVAFLYVLLPRFGIRGYFLSFAITHGVNIILSLNKLLKITDISISVSILLRALGAAGIAILLGNGIDNPLVSVFIGLLILGSLFQLLGVTKAKDFRWLISLIKRKELPR